MWVHSFPVWSGPCAGHVDAERVERLLAAVGEADARALPRAVLHLLAEELPVGHCAIFEFSEQARPQLCCEAGAGSRRPIPDDAGASYVGGHYHADHVYGVVCELLRGRREDGVLVEQGRSDISDRAYLQDCYERGNVADRLSLLVPHRKDSQLRGCLAVNLYRQQGERPFLVDELAAAGPLLRLVAGAVMANRRLGMPLRAAPSPVRARHPLSAREAEIAELVCGGLSTARIAARLRVAPTTVTTLRKRAYEKLGAANAQEFAARWARLHAD